MFPNTASEIYLYYLLSRLKQQDELVQSLAFCQLDVWDSVLLLNCPDRQVFELIFKSKKALATAISQQLPSVKLISMRWKQEVVELSVDRLIGGQTHNHFQVRDLIFGLSDLLKQSAYPVLVIGLDGQILLAFSSKAKSGLSLESVSLSAVEANRLVEVVELHGWVNGYRLKLNSQSNSKGISATVRARLANDSRFDELVLLVQVLNIESIRARTSKAIS